MAFKFLHDTISVVYREVYRILTGDAVVTPMTFSTGTGCVPPERVEHIFVMLRQHLLTSKSTRDMYLDMAAEFYNHLHNPDKNHSSLPTDKDFKNFVASQYPDIKTCPHDMEEAITWGFVKEGTDEPNRIYVLSDLVSSAERSWKDPSATTMTHAQFSLLLMVIIYHELAHAFTKIWFNNLITPPEVGYCNYNSNYGESGYYLEEKLLGGVLLAEWDDVLHIRSTGFIKRLLLRKGTAPDFQYFIIGHEEAEIILSSLCNGGQLVLGNDLDLVPYTPMTTSAWFRVTKSESFLAASSRTLMRLGIRVLVGDDKIHKL